MAARVSGFSSCDRVGHVVGYDHDGPFGFPLVHDDFAVTMMLSGESNRTAVPAIATFLGTTYTEGDVMFSVVTVVWATALLFELVMSFQRQIVGGLTAGP